MAELLYPFLPATGSKDWKGHVTFASAARTAGVEECWSEEGNKTTMITKLLERTFEHRPQRFERLMLEIVRAGILRRKKSDPVTSREIELLNGHLLDLGVKFPELWDPSFLSSLDRGDVGRAEAKLEAERQAADLRESASLEQRRELDRLKESFIELSTMEDRQAAGLKLEKLLTRLFTLSGLNPREPFRVVGEQIDGSFELDHEVYLLEAKREKKALPAAPLYVFREKVTGKSRYTRGLMIAINGVSVEAREAITKGKEAVFFIMDGHDLMMVLCQAIELGEFLRLRFRLLADDGVLWAPFNELTEK